MRLMGEKTLARRRMIGAGVPVVPGTANPLGPDDDLVATAAEIGAEAEVCDVSDGSEVDEVAARIAERHPGGRVLAVTHGGSVRRVQAAALGMALPVLENCGHWVVSCENGAFRAVD